MLPCLSIQTPPPKKAQVHSPECGRWGREQKSPSVHLYIPWSSICIPASNLHIFCFVFPSVDKAGWGKKKVVYNSISHTYLLLTDWCIYFCSSYIFLLMLYTVLPTEQSLKAFFKSLQFPLQDHFSWLSGMPQHVYMTTYLSIHVLLEICVGYLFLLFPNSPAVLFIRS